MSYYFNINITGSDYVVPSGTIEISIFGGTPPYLINYRTFNGSPFTGTKVDNGFYFGYPQYTKAINVPVGMYYIDVIDQYGRGTTITECAVVLFSAHTQENVDMGPEITTFPCEYDHCSDCNCVKPNFYWITTEDGCKISLGYANCGGCYLIGTYCDPVDGCAVIMDNEDFGISDECGWTFLLEDGQPPS
jgi:hypothetical protein